MGRVETKSEKLSTSDLVIERKAKVAILNGLGQILTLRRSSKEETREGEWDWPGGKFEPGESTVLQVLEREVEREEVRGSQLIDLHFMHVIRKQINGGYKVSYLLAGRALFPPEGIVLSDEHDDYDWIYPEEYPNLDIPNKYKNVVANRPEMLAEVVQLHLPSDSEVVKYSRQAA
jgi:8-oxo-dGTP pyrophosphatase MutT (NUDIX family)